ncbi:MAG: PD-(D/E)XK nuclease family protein [Bacilli bacterium]|nr:PD-(D/E)XK nuclease family protein [Bacilli bacterium]
MELINNSIYIVPNSIKKKLLIELSKEKELKNIKFFSLNEFISNVTFSYDEKAIYYLMKEYNYKYDNARIILDNIRYVSNKKYDNKKIQQLSDIKEELKELLIFNDKFNGYMSDKKIYVYGYDFIDKFDLDILSSFNYEIINTENNNYSHQVIKFENMLDEIIYVSNKIRELLDNKIDINKIKIINLPKEYYFLVNQIFKLQNINIVLNDESIFSTSIVKKYLELFDQDKSVTELKEFFNLKDEENLYIYNEIINLLNKYSFDMDKNIKKEILISELKSIKVNKINYKNMIEIIDINDISEDEYAFILGFNEGNFPVNTKDEDYLTDKEKELLAMSLSYEKNNFIRKGLINKIKSIKNLFISYKLRTSFDEYFKSSLIDDLGYEEIAGVNDIYNYSNSLNRILISTDLDNYIKYGEKSNELSLLFNNYKDIDYLSFDNKYKKIDKSKLYKKLNDKLTLSYSSIDNYYKCKFRYYLNNILDLDRMETTFEIFIGNLFHHILSKCFESGFAFEKEYEEYIKEYEFSNKEKFFINKLKEDLLFIIDTINKQNELGNFKKSKYENKFSIDKSTTIKVNFIGYIDKLMEEDYKGKKLLVIIDYKTGNPELNLTNTYYGLNMQLPIYLYLSKSERIENSEVVGFYLQKILNTKAVIDDKKTVLEQKEDNLKLQGYTIYDEELINEFDKSYSSSKKIKSLSTTKDGFGFYSKLLTKNQMDELYKLVDKKIDEARDGILEADFEINPKRIKGKNVSCDFCNFKDICYMSENNIKILKEIKDLSFLGGEEDA